MRTLSLFTLAAILATLGACATSDNTPAAQEEGVAAAAKAPADGAKDQIPVYLIETESERLEVVPVPRPPNASIEDAEDRATAAIETLMAIADDDPPGHSNLWLDCGIGTGVDSVVSLPSEPAVVVTLTGQNLSVCDLSMDAFRLRSQQLAWTVVTNLDVPETTPVRLLAESGESLLSDTVPDPAYLTTD